MLVITRRVFESVVLKLEDGRTVEIIVADVERGKVRLGFRCPEGIKILREELLAPRRSSVLPPAEEGR